MGELVMAAKITHVPSIWLSIQPGKHFGIRRPAELALTEVGERARERGADTFLIADTHWMNSIGFHLNGKARHQGSYVSHELPHFIHDLEYDYPGAPDLAELVREEIVLGGQKARVHTYKDLGLEYATLVPMYFMNGDSSIHVLPIGCNIYSTIEENRRIGEALMRAIHRSDRKVAFLASGSLSHAFPPNEIAESLLDDVSSEINRQVDMAVLDMWTEGRVGEFLEMLPDYNKRCTGEGAMADTAMLFGLLGWGDYAGKGEQLCPYFGSSGTGQVVVDFPVPVTVE
ncbi:3,4-dihydroxyphenylacetate 2,3-dioxygenase [Sphaerisporangium krabiense]|uniref:3,4-dihydroxyphenylacetate 2,3-dioxygenase n=1 Tax=Sphaerisporangium krabiense TaxID=763782 RepID=A0A7W9DSF3_9ACTN|nr:3,4-dihydroxyphenylacetate 2,3-dioxygenase [Sphaerisporangium krabiense]MBB5628375.1 3,4-dihydroxyphenylacetate 2,3-dioxygenase [Sphaerisporangium krabiense]GII66885.1 3,4-dihydroxyphenylacetate 2,3-dioxygenase [Sphaerisporangium krabiense]